jgi:hypothetical protein
LRGRWVRLSEQLREIKKSYISISEKKLKKTHQRLINLGRKNETFDEIIQRFIRFYENHKGGAVAA